MCVFLFSQCVDSCGYVDVQVYDVWLLCYQFQYGMVLYLCVGIECVVLVCFQCFVCFNGVFFELDCFVLLGVDIGWVECFFEGYLVFCFIVGDDYVIDEDVWYVDCLQVVVLIDELMYLCDDDVI